MIAASAGFFCTLPTNSRAMQMQISHPHPFAADMNQVLIFRKFYTILVSPTIFQSLGHSLVTVGRRSMSRDRKFVKIVFALLWALLTVPLIQAASVRNFRCDELESEYASSMDNNYCTVSDMLINHDTQVNCDVHQQFRYQVRTIKFYSSQMLFIPFGIFRYFQGVHDLDISDSFVIDIPRNTFEAADELLYLSVSHNNLTELGSSVFVGANSLYLLNISHNHISHINRYAFTGIPALSRLDLSHNNLSNIDPALFQDLIDIDKIYLNDNQLLTIAANQFVFNTQLRSIELANNRLVEFETWRLYESSLLEELQVSGNSLQHFDATGFPSKFRSLRIANNNLTELNITNLEDLEASNNRIHTLVINTPETLRRLIMANNSLTNFDNIGALTHLEILDLSANCVRIHMSRLSSLKRLTILNLARTCLGDLNFGIFSAQRSLESLDISYNNLTEVNLDLFAPYLNQLESLFIDGNNITEIGGLFHLNISTVFPSLSTLGMSNNPFNCTYLTQLFRLFNTHQIKLPIDPDLSAVNTTHVFGIACTNNKSNPTTFKNPPPNTSYDHLMANHHRQHQNLIAQVERLKMDVMITKHEHELRAQRQKLEQSQLHQQMLLTNLLAMKFVIGIACAVGLVVVAMKCVAFYRKNRDFMVVSTMSGNATSLYRSTTTMDTLQTSVEPGV